MADVRDMAAQAVQAVRGYVENAFSKAETRIDELAQQLGSFRDSLAREIESVRQSVNELPKPERGEKGDPGSPGDTGLRGEPGEKGEKGDPGRDALEIEVLSRIDPTKAYPRGTFATHHGGLVRAVRRTDPLGDDLAASGWAVLVDGVREVGVEQRGERSFAVSIAKTSGAVQVVEARMNIVLDRGVWRDERAYEHGDSVSFGGSTWIAQKDAPEGKPGMSDDWRLAVKRGRDGKDWRPPA